MLSVVRRASLLVAAAVVAAGSVACGPPTGPADPSSSGAGTSTADPPPPKKTGPSAPDFTLSTLDGDTITLSDYEGDKVVLVDFWSTSCAPCLEEMPELVKIYQEKKAQGFEILAITIDGPNTMPQVSQVVKSKGMIFPILLDPETEVMDRFNPKGELPFTVVIDRSGSIVLQRASYTAGDEASMRSLVEAIDGALAQK